MDWQLLKWGTLVATNIVTSGTFIGHDTNRHTVEAHDLIELVQMVQERSHATQTSQGTEGLTTNVFWRPTWTADPGSTNRFWIYYGPEGTNEPEHRQFQIWDGGSNSTTTIRTNWNTFTFRVDPVDWEWIYWIEETNRFIWSGWSNIVVSGFTNIPEANGEYIFDRRVERYNATDFPGNEPQDVYVSTNGNSLWIYPSRFYATPYAGTYAIGWEISDTTNYHSFLWETWYVYTLNDLGWNPAADWGREFMGSGRFVSSWTTYRFDSWDSAHETSVDVTVGPTIRGKILDCPIRHPVELHRTIAGWNFSQPYTFLRQNLEDFIDGVFIDDSLGDDSEPLGEFGNVPAGEFASSFAMNETNVWDRYHFGTWQTDQWGNVSLRWPDQYTNYLNGISTADWLNPTNWGLTYNVGNLCKRTFGNPGGWAGGDAGEITLLYVVGYGDTAEEAIQDAADDWDAGDFVGSSTNAQTPGAFADLYTDGWFSDWWYRCELRVCRGRPKVTNLCTNLEKSADCYAYATRGSYNVCTGYPSMFREDVYSQISGPDDGNLSGTIVSPTWVGSLDFPATIWQYLVDHPDDYPPLYEYGSLFVGWYAAGLQNVVDWEFEHGTTWIPGISDPDP